MNYVKLFLYYKIVYTNLKLFISRLVIGLTEIDGNKWMVRFECLNECI